MNETAFLHQYLIVGALLVGIGLVGFVSRRNMIVMFLSAELVLQGVGLSMAAWSRFHNNFSGQAFVVFIIAVAACEAAIAMALVLALWRYGGSLDVASWRLLGESGVEPCAEEPTAEEPPPAPDWPRLPTAGVRPETPPERDEYRDNV